MKIKNIKKEYENITIQDKFNENEFLKYSLEKKFGYIMKIIEKYTNKKLYDHQIQASEDLYNNKAIDLATGGGKSLASIIPLILKTLENNKVSYFISINEFLLKRDFNEFKKIYEYFGIKISFLFKDFDTTSNKQIVYTTNSFLISNYLNNFVSLNKTISIDIKNSYFLIDEADMVLIDNALYPFVLHTTQPLNQEYLIDIYNYTKDLTTNDYTIKEHNYYLTEATIENLNKNFENFDINSLVFSIENCLYVLNNYKKDIDYIIEDNIIFSINPKTGLKEVLNTKDYTKQFITLKEGLELEKIEKVIIDKISVQSFFKSIDNKAAMSGTTIHESKYFTFYGFDISKIKSSFKDIKKIYPTKIYFNTRQKIINLLKDIEKLNERPILITTNNIKSAELIFNTLKEYYQNNEKILSILTAKNIEDDFNLIQKMGNKNTITVSTQIAGRGIDIPINDEIEKIGGLHVMLFEVNNGFRIDEQLIGRTGRQGKNGSVQFYYSLEDPLLVYYLNDKLKNIFYRLNLKEDDVIESRIITKQIKQTQMKQEQLEYQMFENMANFSLVLDDSRNNIHSLITENKNCNDYNQLLKKIMFNILDLYEKPQEKIDFFETLGVKLVDLEIKEYYQKEKKIIENLNRFILENLSEKDVKTIIHQVILVYYIKFLKNCDIVQEGITWRSRANKDPIIEFKKEVFNMFEITLKNIRVDCFVNCFKNIQFRLEKQKKQEK